MVMMMKSMNVIDFDFDYYPVASVCDDDDGDFYDGDDDVYEISSFFSFFYASLSMTVK